MFTEWPCPLLGGGISKELAVSFKQDHDELVLLIPPLFDEHNKFRRQMIEIMRRLSLSHIDCVLPDCPGWNESLQPLAEQQLSGWQDAMEAAARHFGATRILTFRSGALLAPSTLPGWRYAPVGGKQVLRGMLRARAIASREAGREEKIAELREMGCGEGIELAGWHLNTNMFRELEAATIAESDIQITINQELVGGSGLWLRVEPDDDPEQADAIAAMVVVAMQGA